MQNIKFLYLWECHEGYGAVLAARFRWLPLMSFPSSEPSSSKSHDSYQNLFFDSQNSVRFIALTIFNEFSILHHLYIPIGLVWNRCVRLHATMPLLSPIIKGNEKGRILNHELVSVKKTSGVIVFWKDDHLICRSQQSIINHPVAGLEPICLTSERNGCGKRHSWAGRFQRLHNLGCQDIIKRWKGGKWRLMLWASALLDEWTCSSVKLIKWESLASHLLSL